jgi:hypothetical protein
MRSISDQYVITQALRGIHGMTLAQPLPWTELHPYEWLKSRVRAIVVSYPASYNYCCHTVFPLGQPENVQAITLSLGATIVFCTETKAPPVDQKMVTQLC